MPILATAVIWLVAERHRAGDAFGTGEVLVTILAMIAPMTLVAGTSDFPLAVLSLILLLGAILRRCWRLRSPAASAQPLAPVRG
jgi:phosphate/sulfate permease